MLFWTAVLVVRRLLTVGGVLGWVAATWSYIITSCPEALIVELAIVTIPLLLLRLHLQVLNMLFILLGLVHLHVVHLDALRGGVAQPLNFPIVMLHFDLLQPFVCDLA